MEMAGFFMSQFKLDDIFFFNIDTLTESKNTWVLYE